MYTRVILEGKLLSTLIVSNDEDDVIEDKWKRAIAPGVVWLYHNGGGEMTVYHDPDDICL